MGTLAGPLVGALTLPWLTQTLQFLQAYRFLVFGPLLIALLIFLPNGIVGLYESARVRRAARRARPASPLSGATSGDGHA
jgi:branched-chain amino acid transport system permease protein